MLGGISVRQLYYLMKSDQHIQAAVVEIPGMRGTFLNVERLRAAVEAFSYGMGG